MDFEFRNTSFAIFLALKKKKKCFVLITFLELYRQNEASLVQNNEKFLYKTNLVVVLILPLFLDEILILRILHQLCKMLFTGFRPLDCARYFWPVSLQFAGFLVPLCPKRALVWGMVVRGLRIEIFVRVLHSSRVNLNNVNNTNVFCWV